MRTIYPQPGYTEADLDTLLASRQFVFADCYTVNLVDGSTIYRYTNAQQDVSVVEVDTIERQLYLSKLVQLTGLRFKIGVGVEVDEQTVTFNYDESYDLFGQRFAYSARLGWMDGATIKRDRYFAYDWGAPWIAGMKMFTGQVSTLDSVGRTQAKFKVKSALNLLNVDMPRFMWQPGCVNTLYDESISGGGCNVDPDLHNTTVMLASDGTTTILPWAGASDDYLLGKVHIENGDGVTRVRSITEVNAGVYIVLSYPLDFIPETGTQFIAYEGCDRTSTRCQLFPGDYKERFRAYPFVPVAETAA